MNRTKIEWTDYTWNPITGCRHGCKYCYARKIATRFKDAFPNGFEPTFHQERLRDPFSVKKPSKIFTVSMGDMFGEWVPEEWVIPIFQVMGACKQHTFQILTKNPKRINSVVSGDLFSPNIWLGTSVESSSARNRIDELRKVPRFKKFVSFEPLKEEVRPNLTDIDWVIIGAQTNPLVLPDWKWIDRIVYEADINQIPVFVKNNVVDHANARGYQDFPEDVAQNETSPQNLEGE